MTEPHNLQQPTAPAAAGTFNATLPDGRLRFNEPMARHTTIGVGGRAAVFAEVCSLEELAAVRAEARRVGLPIVILGGGSNALFDDGDLPMAAICLAGAFAELAEEGGGAVSVGAACSLAALVQWTAERARSGMAWAAGIPGSVGGGLAGNCGAYGASITDGLIDVTVVDADEHCHCVPATAIRYGYRTSSLTGQGRVIASARFALPPGDGAAIRQQVAETIALRRVKLPPGKTAGSVFRNPPGQAVGRLLEQCGMKGAREGGAVVSAIHANVIVNTGGASAADVRRLMARMAEAVETRFGIRPEPEIIIIGPPPAPR